MDIKLGGKLSRLIRPAVFGAFDGLVTVLGAVFQLAHDPKAMWTTAIGLAVGGTISMGGGEWLSDSEHGLGSSLVIGATTGLGTVLPALPYVAVHGRAGVVLSCLLCLATATGIAWARVGPSKTLRRALAETHGVLAVAAGLTLLAAWATGAVG